MTERIKIEVDDTDMARFEMRLNLILQQSSRLFGTTDIKAGAKASLNDFQTLGLAVGTFTDDQLALISDKSRLPSLTREMRIILGQLPGMRQAIQALFLARRQLRGIAIGGPLEFVPIPVPE